MLQAAVLDRARSCFLLFGVKSKRAPTPASSLPNDPLEMFIPVQTAMP
jgi:hypothetical protein